MFKSGWSVLLPRPSPSRMECLKKFCIENGIRTVLELGTGMGDSTSWFVEAGCETVTVDIGNFDVCFDFHTASKIVADDRFLPIRENAKFDLVFVDSSHEYEHTKYEISLALRHATRFLAFDDISWVGVNRALAEANIKWYGIGHDIGAFRIAG